MNEVMPRPSQPRSKAIMWGIKIRKFMEDTNRIIRVVNRCINGSFSM